ncbi:MAG TPA: sporulation integral membrane protein YlbJ [Bacillus sp. (in: firmicutes)]|uniref:sporulation integral membrane protein YlbJ n=1 Tax=Bacillus litorisediminis TaxID=2922713 RepID=UPI001FAB84B3|nr:sporulation integral membrane protein YlbJ [Bacillus litorisediminis]HWO74815.1 sporulation integral membrane protein YlbJ [Bacillus sp. (in: firmicutes)]
MIGNADQGGKFQLLNRSKLKTLVLALSVTLMAISLIVFPEEAFEASIRGLNMWWEIVFPSLLPFFIISEMLIGLGVVKFIGVLLEPFMRPLFRVPGVGGFVWAMGMASGNPAGAKLSARLRQEKQITRIEAERLASFTNCSNPLFIFGAVSVGFFNNPRLGIILAAAHYLGNFFVGLVMRYHGRKEERGGYRKERRRVSIRKALRALHRTRISDKRPLGQILGDAVISSIQTLLMIGGFIILFSVVNKLLFHLHITSAISFVFNQLFSLFQLPKEMSIPFISGLFEITLGSQMMSQIQESSVLQQAILVSFILAFAGFSIQAQVASIFAQTDIRFKPFFIARLLQGIFAALITIILWNPLYKGVVQKHPSESIPVYGESQSVWNEMLLSLKQMGPLLTILALSLSCLILLGRIRKTRG